MPKWVSLSSLFLSLSLSLSLSKLSQLIANILLFGVKKLIFRQKTKSFDLYLWGSTPKAANNWWLVLGLLRVAIKVYKQRNSVWMPFASKGLAFRLWGFETANGLSARCVTQHKPNIATDVMWRCDPILGSLERFTCHPIDCHWTAITDLMTQHSIGPNNCL